MAITPTAPTPSPAQRLAAKPEPFNEIRCLINRFARKCRQALQIGPSTAYDVSVPQARSLPGFIVFRFTPHVGSLYADVAAPVMPATARRQRGMHGRPAYAVKLTTSLKARRGALRRARLIVPGVPGRALHRLSPIAATIAPGSPARAFIGVKHAMSIVYSSTHYN
ncbi:hypothetical protein AWB70_03882 [Caballeronia cordobensis]|uniref:Uncharacterized protein n=1 Tax=Caballeronia cordobensis TaxID=1353886 RepID=A0A158HXV3_CABCO|nr:hypothetical protein [Caballeronia cordobensis]SAL48550.1 hypothetical protein AWB70_03882 [Caballeronia cordobensis]